METEPGIAGFAVIDTETNSLMDFKLAADAEGQARLCEICIIRVSPDLQIEGEYHAYVVPVGWSMTGDAEEANGITDELLLEHGIPIADVLAEYNKAIDEGRTIVAFGAQFDLKVMRGEMRRAGMADRFEESENICVMRGSAPLCNIPWPNGRRGFKWPRLTEALTYFGIEYSGPLGARRDAMGALNIFKQLIERGYCPEARVHRAKNYPLPTTKGEGA